MRLYKGRLAGKAVEFTFNKTCLPLAPAPCPPARCAIIIVPHPVTKYKLLFLLKLVLWRDFYYSQPQGMKQVWQLSLLITNASCLPHFELISILWMHVYKRRECVCVCVCVWVCECVSVLNLWNMENMYVYIYIYIYIYIAQSNTTFY